MDTQKRCEYEVYNPNTGKMQYCGDPAQEFPHKGLMQKIGCSKWHVPCLCDKHRAFVIDAIMPLAAQYGKQIALIKKEKPARKKRICPHCGKEI